MQMIIKVSKACLLFTIMTLFFALLPVMPSSAREKPILNGIFVDDISLGGKTYDEAMSLVKERVSELGQKEITINIINGNYIIVTPDELGFSWNNPEIIEEAAALGQKGNIIRRYKAIKDLENANKVFELNYSFDTAMISDIITEQCGGYNIPAVDASLEIIGNERVITEGQTGLEIDLRASIDLVADFLDNEWNKDKTAIDLIVNVTEPRGSYEELSRVTDILGTFSTSFSTSNNNRSINIANGTKLCSGILLYPGDEFDSLAAVMPFTEDNGYELAGSFLQGQLIDSLGGGICQVTTTLYKAVLLAELEITERHAHSMMVSYVEPSMDAAIAESSGKNFKFVNNTDSPIYIEGLTTSNKTLIFNIYGIESRPANRTISFVSEVLEERHPDGEVIRQDAGHPVGFISVQSAYIGNRSRLWKVIREDGVEVGRERVNSSSYIAVPRTAIVGIYTNDGAALEHIYAAIATNNIDHIRNVANALSEQLSPPPPPEEGDGGHHHEHHHYEHHEYHEHHE